MCNAIKISEVSEQVFGILTTIGSSVYLLLTIILRFLYINKYDSKINLFGLVYLIISVTITEVYAFVNLQKISKIPLKIEFKLLNK